MLLSILGAMNLARSLVGTFWGYVSILMNALVQLLLIATLLFAVAYRMGWWHRLLWHFLEQLGRKALNGTPVTIGSFAVDWLHGIFILNNVVVHAPHRVRFGWASPVIVRVGHVRVEFNPAHCLFAMIVLGENPPVLDVNLLHVSDIQCFLERSGHVFNVYLLDPLYEMPKNAGIQQPNSEGDNDNKNGPEQQEQQNSSDGPIFVEADMNFNYSSIRMVGSDRGDTTIVEDEDDTTAGVASSSSFLDFANDPEAAAEVDRAELVVGEMLKAVHDLGRAVQEGQLPQALQEQRQRIARGLKEFHVDKRAMTQGLSLVGKVGQMVAEKSQQAVAQSNLILQGPKRRPPPQNQPQLVILARFGRVILDDLRVFTRTTAVVEQEEDEEDEDEEEEIAGTVGNTGYDNQQSVVDESNRLTTASHHEGEGVEVTPRTQQQQPKFGETMRSSSLPLLSTDGAHHTTFTTTSTPSVPSGISNASTGLATSDSQQLALAKTKKKKKRRKTTKKQSFWNKPIKLERVAVRASEFGAPLSAKDEQGFPVLFQPLERSTDAILKRVVGDIAKCNTGRLVRTALGEVLDFYMEREYGEETSYFNKANTSTNTNKSNGNNSSSSAVNHHQEDSAASASTPATSNTRRRSTKS